MSKVIGIDWCTKIDGSVYKPQTISAMVLMQLKSITITADDRMSDAEIEQAMRDAQKKQIKGDMNALSKLLSKLRVDKVTETEVVNIRQAKENLERSSTGILHYGN